jgi:hypothetical protein
VTAKIIANGRVDTTQGIDMTKRLIATELINAINATTPSVGRLKNIDNNNLFL